MGSVPAKNSSELSELVDSYAEEYAGDVMAEQAYDYLKKHKDAAFVDVRTQPEWQFIGMANLQDTGHEVQLVSWMMYPEGTQNPNFAKQLEQNIPNKETPLFFICRSGSRSLAAAKFATKQGYKYCFNIEDGFEGKLDANGQRGKRSGWKASKLPWAQT